SARRVADVAAITEGQDLPPVRRQASRVLALRPQFAHSTHVRSSAASNCENDRSRKTHHPAQNKFHFAAPFRTGRGCRRILAAQARGQSHPMALSPWYFWEMTFRSYAASGRLCLRTSVLADANGYRSRLMPGNRQMQPGEVLIRSA